MMKLEIPRKDAANMALVDKLTELALAHQVGVNSKLKIPLLTDGATLFEGKEAIENYLIETEHIPANRIFMLGQTVLEQTKEGTVAVELELGVSD